MAAVTAKVVSRSSTITVNGSLAQVFPLFGPLREREWAEGWDPRMVLPYAEDVEEHMVFQTQGSDPLDPATYTWIVSRYDPARAFVEYTVFTPTRIWWIAIQCQERPQAPGTSATISYTYLGLTEEGHRRNQAALRAMFREDLRDWEAALNHYLETGELLRGTDMNSA